MPDRTPLYDWHVARGARMVDFAGWDMPVQYSSIVEEHQAVRTEAGLFDISHMGRLVFEGPGALDLIQHVYTNDAAAMKLGQVRYGLVCNEAGGILDDVLVYRFPTYWMMVVNASNRTKIVDWLAKHQGSRNVRVSDITSLWAMVALQGPRAVDILTKALAAPEWLPPVVAAPILDDLTQLTVGTAGRAWVESLAGRPLADMPYYYAQIVFDSGGASGIPDLLVVSRTGYTGEDGYEVILQSSRVTAFCDHLVQTAGELGVPLKPCGLGARDTLRLEAAMPLYGHELSEDIDPLQAGLGWAVKLNKGEFIGRAAIAERSAAAGRRQRVGLELAGKRIAREGTPIHAGGAEVGRVTSGTFGPTVQKAIAMAYVQPNYATPGTLCEALVRGKPEPAKVVPLPFYSRKRLA